VTHRARGEQFFVDLIFLHQPPPQRQLVFRRLPIHAEDMLTRSEKAFRLAMALQAPFHQERLRLPHQRHLIDPAMTADAANPFLHVDAVIEVDEAGEVVDSRPGDRPVGLEAVADRGQHGAVGPDLSVTVHADLRRRKAGKTGYLYGGMAVAAIDAESTDMMLVAEGDRLLTDDAGLRDVR